MGDTEPLEDGVKVQDPVQECTDLINNRGCVKQFVNGGIIFSCTLMTFTNASKIMNLNLESFHGSNQFHFAVY